MTAKLKTQYLERRLGGYFFRRRIPKSNLHAVPKTKTFPCVSLRTHVPREAEILTCRLKALTDKAFAWTAEFGMVLDQQAQQILEVLARFEIAAHHALRAAASERSRAAAQAAHDREIALQNTLRDALLRGDREIARAPLRQVAARLGVVLSEDTPDWQTLAFEATRVLLDIGTERARRELGEFSEPSPYFQSLE